MVKFNDTGNDTEGLRISIDDKIVFEKWDEKYIRHNDIVAEIILEILGHVFIWESDYPEEKDEENPDYLHDINGNLYDIDDFPGHR